MSLDVPYFALDILIARGSQLKLPQFRSPVVQLPTSWQPFTRHRDLLSPCVGCLQLLLWPHWLLLALRIVLANPKRVGPLQKLIG
jgi:hypothetical protein